MYTIFVIYLLVSAIEASPSVDSAKRFPTSRPLISEDIAQRQMERVVNETLTKTIKEYVEPLQRSVEKLAQTVEQLQNLIQSQAQMSTNMEHFTAKALRSDEQIASVERTVQNLTQSQSQMSTNVEQLTAVASRSDERIASVERTFQNLTQSQSQISTDMEHFTAKALRSDEQIASVERTVQNLTQSQSQMSTDVDQLTAVASRSDERIASVERTARNLTQSLGQMKRCGFTAGYEYSDVTGRCYKLHTEEERWSVAVERCRVEKALLAVIDSREEARVLGDIGRRVAWVSYIGVSRNSNGLWITSTGEDVLQAAGYNVWRGGQQPGSGTQLVYGYLYNDGTISAASNSITYPYICERAP